MSGAFGLQQLDQKKHQLTQRNKFFKFEGPKVRVCHTEKRHMVVLWLWCFVRFLRFLVFILRLKTPILRQISGKESIIVPSKRNSVPHECLCGIFSTWSLCDMTSHPRSSGIPIKQVSLSLPINKPVAVVKSLTFWPHISVEVCWFGTYHFTKQHIFVGQVTSGSGGVDPGEVSLSFKGFWFQRFNFVCRRCTSPKHHLLVTEKANPVQQHNWDGRSSGDSFFFGSSASSRALLG